MVAPSRGGRLPSASSPPPPVGRLPSTNSENNMFHTTHWSVVLAAKGDDTKARAALRELCESYREPILRSIQRYSGRQDAEDLTHDFLARLLEGKTFRQLDRQGGSFRSYLLGAVRHFLAKTREREAAAKRGGGIAPVSILPDHPAVEKEELLEELFDRDWAQTMVARTLDSLEKTPETQTLLPWVTREMDVEARARIGAQLDMSDVAVKVALHRLRKKFRETIRKRIAETVRDESEIDGELDHLIRALRRSSIDR